MHEWPTPKSSLCGLTKRPMFVCSRKQHAQHRQYWATHLREVLQVSLARVSLCKIGRQADALVRVLQACSGGGPDARWSGPASGAQCRKNEPRLGGARQGPCIVDD